MSFALYLQQKYVELLISHQHFPRLGSCYPSLSHWLLLPRSSMWYGWYFLPGESYDLSEVTSCNSLHPKSVSFDLPLLSNHGSVLPKGPDSELLGTVTPVQPTQVIDFSKAAKVDDAHIPIELWDKLIWSLKLHSDLRLQCFSTQFGVCPLEILLMFFLRWRRKNYCERE